MPISGCTEEQVWTKTQRKDSTEKYRSKRVTRGIVRNRSQASGDFPETFLGHVELD